MAPERWRECASYLRGIDLYNFAYWWECHEELEGLWHAVGHETEPGQFLQGIIQVSAANLKRFQGSHDTARDLAAKGLARHRGIGGIYLGVDVAAFATEVGDYFAGRRDRAAMITLRER